MYLKTLRLHNFKNYAEATVEFGDNIQCLLGNNGSGKTNLLDAIYYLSQTKSALNPFDAQNIRKGDSQFTIRGEFIVDGKSHVVYCSFKEGGRKLIEDDGEEPARFSGHIGKYPVVLVAPHDIELIWDGSELRRRFFDNLISQISREYLEHLIVYTHHLRQRNSLLKVFSEGNADPDMLEVYNGKLVESGGFIYRKRKEVLETFRPLLESNYRLLTGVSSEPASITYRSELETGDFAEALRKNLSRDILLQRTGFGIHRDDFLFSMNEGELKRLGSQGQQKSFLIALKLAEFLIISKNKGLKPLLLLDDVFDKLDDQRIGQLMNLIAGGTFGQLFITDARAERSRAILREAGVRATVFEVAAGNIRPI